MSRRVRDLEEKLAWLHSGETHLSFLLEFWERKWVMCRAIFVLGMGGIGRIIIFERNNKKVIE